MSLVPTILSNLIENESYSRKVLPFLKEEFFLDKNERRLFSLIASFVETYNNVPSKEALKVTLSEQHIDQKTLNETLDYIDNLTIDPSTNAQWLEDHTEKFCQDRALYNALSESIRIWESKKEAKGLIPKMLTDALGVSFDNHIGHDFLDDFQSRYDFYHNKEVKLPFRLDYFNRITKGGIASKTLTVILAGTGVGKSLCMCDFAASNLMDGKNVLYITMEMAEERIAERIDANLIDCTTDELSQMSHEEYTSRIKRIKNKTLGKMIIKEYPTASAGANNFRHLLNELKIKKNFEPDVVYIDYLNICMSSRLKTAINVNSYTYVKAIAEEIRGLAVEYNIPIITASQLNRTGFNSSDPGLENTSESFGLPATADLMFALISNEELDQLSQLMVKQLKNRYCDPSNYRRFVVGIDRSRMKLYDVEQGAQDDIINREDIDKPLMDKTTFGMEDANRKKRGKGKNAATDLVDIVVNGLDGFM